MLLMLAAELIIHPEIRASQPCLIKVVEKSSGWPVPLVELKTTHNMTFFTDNAGIIAFDLPELMGRETWFDVHGDGYEVPKDGFGYRGVRLKPEPGKEFTIKVRRTSIAKRIGRLTGGGLFGESQQCGRNLDWRESGVLGCDSVQNAEYKGRLFWIWGDTTLPDYPLGIFDSSCATTGTQPLSHFEPPLRLEFDYFHDSYGKPRGVAKMPGKGPTWLSALTTLPDAEGTPHLVATYSKINGPMEAYECGLCAWNDASNSFQRVRVIWSKSEAQPKPPPFPDGHSAFWTDDSGKEWALFGNPLPTLRCPASFEAWQNPSTWEILAPQKHLTSATDGSPVKPNSGSIAWNSYRQRWVTVFVQALGKPSGFGEVWYAEADSPFGPWRTAVKVLSHANYTFYNPEVHGNWTPPNSPVLFFEGTYSTLFANHAEATPRYDYNQILYRLDLDDLALKPAQE